MKQRPAYHHRQQIRQSFTLALPLALCLLLAGCWDGLFFKPDYTLSGLPAEEATANELASYFDDETGTVTLPEDRAQTDAAAAQASETLRQHMTDKLYSLGYYDGDVIFTPGKDTWDGTFTLKPGERYTVAKVSIRGGDPDKKEREYLEPLVALKGAPLDAASVLAAKDEVQNRLDRRSCRYGTTLDHTAYIDRQHKTADLAFTLKQGPEATLGNVTFAGQQTVRESYLQKNIPWQPGDCFRQSKVEDLRGALFQSGLFSGVDIAMPEKPGKDGRVDITVTVTERPMRSFNAGLTYYSDEGPGLSLGWTHRNLLGGAEQLDATLKVSSIEQSLSSKLTSPFFLRKDQKLSLNAGIKNEDTDAYNSKSISTGAAISRALNKRLSVSTGVNFTYSRITDNLTFKEDTFGLVSFPQTISYDSRRNPLDPKRAWFIEADVEPFFNTLGSAVPFVKMSGTIRRYQPLGKNNVLALRAKAGAIQGATLADVPADERFYTGGGGSVRGFAYQSIGPEKNGDPTGGRGLAEGNIELRHKFNDDYGAVAFIDAGSLTENSTPDFKEIAVGAGVGLRYYTAVGPIRFDVATPLNNQDQTADQVQFYISLGQAF